MTWHSSTYHEIAAPAAYGRNPNGAQAARDEWWNNIHKNDADQNTVQGAESYANEQAQAQRGPQAVENQEQANNEASGAGGHQAGAIDAARTLATGSQPSAGAMQLQQGLSSSLAQQKAAAAGARGSAALATAGSNAAANSATLQQNAYTQGGLLRSRDMSAGRGLLNTQLGVQRDQDNARQGQANEMSQFNADLNDKYRLGMGQAGVQLGGVSNAQNQQDYQWYQGGMNPIDAQSEANQQARRWLWDAQNQEDAHRAQDDS